MTEDRISVIVDRTFDRFREDVEGILELTADACLAYKIGMLHERMRNTLLNELKGESEGD